MMRTEDDTLMRSTSVCVAAYHWQSL